MTPAARQAVVQGRADGGRCGTMNRVLPSHQNRVSHTLKTLHYSERKV